MNLTLILVSDQCQSASFSLRCSYFSLQENKIVSFDKCCDYLLEGENVVLFKYLLMAFVSHIKVELENFTLFFFGIRNIPVARSDVSESCQTTAEN